MNLLNLRLGYGVPPTQLAVSFISHEYHYVGICGDDMLWLWLWGLPQSDKICTVCSLVHWACGLSAGYSWNLFFLRQIFT